MANSSVEVELLEGAAPHVRLIAALDQLLGHGAFDALDSNQKEECLRFVLAMFRSLC